MQGVEARGHFVFSHAICAASCSCHAFCNGGQRKARVELCVDFVLVFETAHNEELPELLFDFVTTRINITVDARTTHGRERLKKIENEIRRLVHTKRKGDGTNFDRLVYKTRTDLSDRSKKLFRMTFQIEVIIFAELIP